MGGGTASRPPTKRRRGILFGLCLRDNWDGICLAVRIRHWEKVIYLKRYPEPEFVKAPELPDPSSVAKMPVVKLIEPEDMDKEPEPVKLTEPEDM